jgi:hypothetical protein
LLTQDVEISTEVYLIQREVAEAYKAAGTMPPQIVGGSRDAEMSTAPQSPRGVTDEPTAQIGGVASVTNVPRLVWSGEIPHQKWMNFYTKVLSKFAATPGMKVTLRVDVAPAEGISPQKVDETRVALRELGLNDSLKEE